MDNFSGTDLFEMKATLEKQFEQDYIRSPGSKAKRFDFLIGEWDLTRKSFDSQGEVARETRGIVVARYTFEGRVIQEDFHNYLANGEALRWSGFLGHLSAIIKWTGCGLGLSTERARPSQGQALDW